MFVQQMHLYSTLVEDLTKEVSECGEDSLTSSVGTAAASMGTSLAGSKGSVVINFLEGRFIHQTQIRTVLYEIFNAQSNTRVCKKISRVACSTLAQSMEFDGSCFLDFHFLKSYLLS